jgi:hypothetical protein
MDVTLSTEELRWLRRLDTDSAVKPEAPEPVAGVLVKHGLAIKLAEGGLQLTALGRRYLENASDDR